MKLLTILDWGGVADVRTTDSFADQIGTPECPYVGIAIGPDSDEGRVRVESDSGSATLQAGRVLALRSRNFTITNDGGVGGGLVTTTLQLMLFECKEELAIEVARPNGKYIEPALAVDDNGGTEPASDPGAPSFRFPYTGRRQALVTLVDVSLGEPVDYAVFGQRWSERTQDYEEILLASATAQDMPIGFNVGGTDNAESWDWIRVAVVSNTVAATGDVCVEVDTIGEIGAR